MAIAVIVFMLNACILLGLGWALDVYVIEGAAAYEANAVLDISAQMKPLNRVCQKGCRHPGSEVATSELPELGLRRGRER